jgi:hypothetical protein
MAGNRTSPVLDADITIEELVAAVPAAPAVLRRHGLVCIECGEPLWGTLGDLAAGKGTANLEAILSDLRAAAAAHAGSGRRGEGAS